MDGGNWKEMFYSIERGDLELLRYHLRMGMDPNFQHPEVMSLPLVESARWGRVEMVTLLLESGADPGLTAAWEGLDALQTAEEYQQTAVVDLLRAHLGLPPRTKRWPRLRALAASIGLGSRA